jgi:hypothetical protein
VPDSPSMKTVAPGRGVEAVVIRRNLLPPAKVAVSGRKSKRGMVRSDATLPHQGSSPPHDVHGAVIQFLPQSGAPAASGVLVSHGRDAG